jgi:hypothetical protein
MKRYLPILIFVVAGCITCSKPGNGVIKSYPLDDLQGLIAQSNVAIDKEVTSDGGGSLRIEAVDAITVPLFEIRDSNLENARIFFQAKVRTRDVVGQVFLEMLVHLPGRGEYFSRGLQTLVSGTTDWTSQETPFELLAGQKPDLIKLNLVINGHGIAWIDDIRLVKGISE